MAVRTFDTVGDMSKADLEPGDIVNIRHPNRILGESNRYVIASPAEYKHTHGVKHRRGY